MSSPRRRRGLPDNWVDFTITTLAQLVPSDSFYADEDEETDRAWRILGPVVTFRTPNAHAAYRYQAGQFVLSRTLLIKIYGPDDSLALYNRIGARVADASVDVDEPDFDVVMGP